MTPKCNPGFPGEPPPANLAEPLACTVTWGSSALLTVHLRVSPPARVWSSLGHFLSVVCLRSTFPHVTKASFFLCPVLPLATPPTSGSCPRPCPLDDLMTLLFAFCSGLSVFFRRKFSCFCLMSGHGTRSTCLYAQIVRLLRTLKNPEFSWLWWGALGIPALWEAEAEGLQG